MLKSSDVERFCYFWKSDSFWETLTPAQNVHLIACMHNPKPTAERKRKPTNPVVTADEKVFVCVGGGGGVELGEVRDGGESRNGNFIWGRL